MPYSDKKEKLKGQEILFPEIPFIYAWEKEWDGMPEFENKYKEDYASVIVHFDSEEEVKDFEEKLGKSIPRGTRNNRPSLRYGGKKQNIKYVYVDE